MEKQQEQEKTVLKPCPFCGSTAEYTSGQSVQQNRHYWYIRCTNAVCSATGPLCSTEDDALKKWNGRVESNKRPSIPEILRQVGMYGIHDDSIEKEFGIEADDGVNWHKFKKSDGSFDLHGLFESFSSNMEYIGMEHRDLVYVWLNTIDSIFPIRSRQVATLILAQSLYMASHSEVHRKIDHLKNILSKNNGN